MYLACILYFVQCTMYYLYIYLILIAEQSENKKKVLKAHNKYRKIDNASAMRINTNMSAEATDWAEQMASTGTFGHSEFNTRNRDGENIYYGCGMPDPVGDSTTAW